jgi:hypothetical protein
MDFSHQRTHNQGSPSEIGPGNNGLGSNASRKQLIAERNHGK